MTNVLAGPFCCYHLAHFGAEVVKVEAVQTGDLARQLGADEGLNQKAMGASFLAQNAGKKSVSLNLKSEQGRELFLKLAKTADVVVESFRPGVMDRLGLGFEVLKQHRPELVYCAISGFGQTGPWVNRPAYDQIIQGISGAMSITGDKDSVPLRVGFPLADTLGGMTAAFAISSALHAVPRGCFIDVSMLESLLTSMGWAVSNFLIGGQTPQPQGNENPTSAPSGSFQTADRLINIAANQQKQWENLTACLGLQALQADPSYSTREQRKVNRILLKQELEKVLKTQSSSYWVEKLNQAGVPAGEVLEVAEILHSKQIQERGFIAEFPAAGEVERKIQVLRSGIQIDGKPLAVDIPPPELGQHNAEIWGECGVSHEELAELKKSGII